VRGRAHGRLDRAMEGNDRGSRPEDRETASALYRSPAPGLSADLAAQVAPTGPRDRRARVRAPHVQIPGVPELQPSRHAVGEVDACGARRLPYRQGPGGAPDAGGRRTEVAASDLPRSRGFLGRALAHRTDRGRTRSIPLHGGPVLAECGKEPICQRGDLPVHVNEEICRFKALGRADNIIPLIVAGEPGDPPQECCARLDPPPASSSKDTASLEVAAPA